MFYEYTPPPKEYIYTYMHKYIYQQKNDTQMCSFYTTLL